MKFTASGNEVAVLITPGTVLVPRAGLPPGSSVRHGQYPGTRTAAVGSPLSGHSLPDGMTNKS